MTFETFEELEVWKLTRQLKKEIRELVKKFPVARGSLFETLNHLIDAFDEEYISDKEMKYFREKVLFCIKVLNGYIAYKKKQLTK